MKKVILFILVSTSILLPQQERYYTFSELRGIEDKDGATHLFYRLYNNFDSSGTPVIDNSVYHLNIGTGTDELFLPDHDNYATASITIGDFDFWGNDPAKYIALKTFCGFDCESYIERFDETIKLPFTPGNGSNIEISRQNDSIIYASNPFSKSTDGGKTWRPNFDYQFVSQSPASVSDFFILNNEQQLLKTKDNGDSFYVVDYYFSSEPQMLYDRNNKFIYRLSNSDGNFYLSVSDNSGEPWSWFIKYESKYPIHICTNDSVSGEIYLADGKIILKSTDYGNTFSLFKELDKRIIGIYKKPNSGKLYAATKYELVEIENNDVNILKGLVRDNAFNKWYPLEVKNKWFFEYWIDEYFQDHPGGHYIGGYITKEIIGDSLINNEIFHTVKENDYHLDGYVNTQTYYEVIDSSGILYEAIIDNNGINKFKKDDLSAEVGDTITVDRYFGISVVESEDTIEVFGVSTLRRVINEMGPCYCEHSIVKDVGFFSSVFNEFGGYTIVLKGFIRNGITYGDTTVVNIEDENPFPGRFSLSQNYPNPFNPVTRIRYSISSTQYATLKVYDILGNEIATLVNEEKPAGEYEVQFDGRNLASGIYFYTLRAGNFTLTKKLILMK